MAAFCFLSRSTDRGGVKSWVLVSGGLEDGPLPRLSIWYSSDLEVVQIARLAPSPLSNFLSITEGSLAFTGSNVVDLGSPVLNPSTSRLEPLLGSG